MEFAETEEAPNDPCFNKGNQTNLVADLKQPIAASFKKVNYMYIHVYAYV